MKILFLLILCVSLPARAETQDEFPSMAKDTTTPAANDPVKANSTPGTGAMKDSALNSPAAPPSPAPLTPLASPEKYEAKKYSDEISKKAIDVGAVDQSNVFTVGSNLMVGCVDSSVNGRTDDLCKAAPNDPECVGLNKALDLATNCLEFDGRGKCISYGAAGYSSSDWIAFSSQYSTAMLGCYEAKNKADQRQLGLGSLTEMATQRSTLPNSLSSGDRNSGVTNAAPSNSVNPLSWEVLSRRFNDGSAFMGYENGEIMKRAFAGEAYAAIIKDSPFVTKLDAGQRALIADAVNDPEAAITRAKSGKSKNLAAAPGTTAATEEVVSAETKRANELVAAGKLITTEGSTPPSSFSSPPPPPSAAEEAAAVIAAEQGSASTGAYRLPNEISNVKGRQIASIEKISPTALHPLHELTDHSAMKDANTAADEVTLFKRVHGSYRKRAKSFAAEKN